MDSRRREVSRRDPRSEEGRPTRPPFFFGALIATALVSAAPEAVADAASPSASAGGPPSVVVLVAADAARLQALDCASGRESGSFALPAPAGVPAVPAPGGDGVFVATLGGQLLRLQSPALVPSAHAALGFEATSLAASGGADAVVLAGGSGRTPLSARDPATLASLHEYRLDDGRGATVSSIVDRPQRSRFVVAFSDLDEIWEIDYGRDAEPVLRGLVHDYRMREAVELPGRFTPRMFKLPGATRALVAGAVPHEMLRIDTSGALGVLNLNVRREIERPSVNAVPAPERIAAWRGPRSRGWVLADEGASALRVLDAAAWKLVEPIAVEGEVLAIAALEDGAVLVAVVQADSISHLRVNVDARETRVVVRTPLRGVAPYRFVAATQRCVALVDAAGRWIAGVTQQQ